MNRAIVLDSSPLGLLFQRPGFHKADECREWMKQHLARGTRVVVPEIVVYELKRELLRLRRTSAVAALVSFSRAVPGRFLPINTAAVDLAAELWARARQQGKPTADPHALDVDVILAAQVLAEGLDPPDFVIATSNTAHLSQFVPAELWTNV